MVLKVCPSRRSLLLALALWCSACLGTNPPMRLATSTPMAVLIHLERADGGPVTVPSAVVRDLAEALVARNIVPRTPDAVDFFSQRTTRARLEALAAKTDAPWVVLVEARARFFSQLTGRYRWEVEVRTSVAPRERLDEVQTSELEVAAFLQYQHESERDALAFVRRQLVSDVADLVERVAF